MFNNIILYVSASFLIIFLISIVSYKLYLVDKPSNRKIHSKPVAYTGGIALSFIYILAIYLFDFHYQKFNYIFSIAFLIAIVGFLDDRYNFNVGGKLSLQIIPIIYLIIFQNLNLNQIGDYKYFQLELNSLSIPFTLLSTMFLINSFNYFDGLDGTLSFTIISSLCILLFIIPNEHIKFFLIIILIPILIFLFFNFSILKLPKLFLGDGGSLLLGFITSFTIIYLANQNILHPILLAYSISIFVYEFLAINLIRIIRKKKIFKAGQDHLHHILLKKNKSIILTNFLISIMNVVFFIFGYLSFKFINSLISLVLFIFLFIIYFMIRKKF
ncbi:hypothetical protein OAP88_00680 [Candidatus Pelagibacter sp.]|nr:hypothetical protein [Candidatus Pelagibacter sp.]